MLKQIDTFTIVCCFWYLIDTPKIIISYLRSYKFESGSRIRFKCKIVCKIDFNFDDEPKSGRSNDVDNEDLENEIKNSSKIDTKILAIKFAVSTRTIRNHLHQLNYVPKYQRWDIPCSTESI